MQSLREILMWNWFECLEEHFLHTQCWHLSLNLKSLHGAGVFGGSHPPGPAHRCYPGCHSGAAAAAAAWARPRPRGHSHVAQPAAAPTCQQPAPSAPGLGRSRRRWNGPSSRAGAVSCSGSSSGQRFAPARCAATARAAWAAAAASRAHTAPTASSGSCRGCGHIDSSGAAAHAAARQRCRPGKDGQRRHAG